ncbi:MAG: amidohydrolase family protein [Victivallales bacterium]|nr:amidohydrolase family protein [Victivallales bacterium]
MKTLYTNARILSPGVDLPNASVLEEEGIVVQVYPPSMALPQFDEAIDCNGHLLLPGFFDIHACLPKGKDIHMSLIQAKKTGVMNLLAAVEESDYDMIAKQCKETATVMEKANSNAARVLGVHLAGPYKNTDFLEVKALQKICVIRKVTFDVELPGAMDFAQKLRKEGIVPCCGGCCTDYGALEEALQNGVRDIGGFEAAGLPVVLAGLGEDGFSLEFAGDKAAENAPLIRFMFKTKGLDRLMMTVSAADVTFGEALKNVAAVTGLPLKDLIRTTSLNQAVSLGIHDIGRIEPGYKAEFVLLDDELNVVKTF